MRTIQELATKLNSVAAKRRERINFVVWEKHGKQRIYINSDRLYNTKKCRQSAYIDFETFETGYFTNCPTQDRNWCVSQTEMIIGMFDNWARLARMKYCSSIPFVEHDSNYKYYQGEGFEMTIEKHVPLKIEPVNSLPDADLIR